MSMDKTAANGAASAPVASPAFQQRVQPWLMECFGPVIAGDRKERNHRFLEESLELVQSSGCTASEAHQLVDYVYGRPVGKPAQEVGGVMVTLAALCLANGLDMYAAAEAELARIWTKVEAIRAKQAAKPKHSPLPESAPAAHTPPLLVLNGFQLRDALEFVAPDGTDEQLESEVCIQHGPARTHDEGTDAAGMYCWLSDYPDEGSIRLDDEATPEAEPADPLEMRLPCDIKVGHGTIKKGCSLSTLVNRMEVMHQTIEVPAAIKLPGSLEHFKGGT